jgi:hypothetical protein
MKTISAQPWFQRAFGTPPQTVEELRERRDKESERSTEKLKKDLSTLLLELETAAGDVDEKVSDEDEATAATMNCLASSLRIFCRDFLLSLNSIDGIAHALTALKALQPGGTSTLSAMSDADITVRTDTTSLIAECCANIGEKCVTLQSGAMQMSVTLGYLAESTALMKEAEGGSVSISGLTSSLCEHLDKLNGFLKGFQARLHALQHSSLESTQALAALFEGSKNLEMNQEKIVELKRKVDCVRSDYARLEDELQSTSSLSRSSEHMVDISEWYDDRHFQFWLKKSDERTRSELISWVEKRNCGASFVHQQLYARKFEIKCVELTRGAFLNRRVPAINAMFVQRNDAVPVYDWDAFKVDLTTIDDISIADEDIHYLIPILSQQLGYLYKHHRFRDVNLAVLTAELAGIERKLAAAEETYRLEAEKRAINLVGIVRKMSATAEREQSLQDELTETVKSTGGAIRALGIGDSFMNEFLSLNESLRASTVQNAGALTQLALSFESVTNSVEHLTIGLEIDRDDFLEDRGLSEYAAGFDKLGLVKLNDIRDDRPWQREDAMVVLRECHSSKVKLRRLARVCTNIDTYVNEMAIAQQAVTVRCLVKKSEIIDVVCVKYQRLLLDYAKRACLRVI